MACKKTGHNVLGLLYRNVRYLRYNTAIGVNSYD